MMWWGILIGAGSTLTIYAGWVLAQVITDHKDGS